MTVGNEWKRAFQAGGTTGSALSSREDNLPQSQPDTHEHQKT